MELSLGLIGFGNVGKALARLIDSKEAMLRTQYNLNLSVMGIMTARHGYAIDKHGLDISRAVEAVEQGSLTPLHYGPDIPDTRTFIRKTPTDLFVELSPLNSRTGQPAIDHVRLALQLKRHVVCANKGPIAFAYYELRNLAERNGCGFLFESTVMDGVPVMGLVRETLPAIDIQRIRGIVNSTTNSILTRMESGSSFQEALKGMQAAGIAEANPADDIDGWDAAVKIVILANVLMNANLRPADVERVGIGDVTAEQVQVAAQRGQAVRLVCEAHREDGLLRASVKPVTLPFDDPLAHVRGTANLLMLETDMISQMAILEGETTPTTTAYGILVDIINIARGHYR